MSTPSIVQETGEIKSSNFVRNLPIKRPGRSHFITVNFFDDDPDAGGSIVSPGSGNVTIEAKLIGSKIYSGVVNSPVTDNTVSDLPSINAPVEEIKLIFDSITTATHYRVIVSSYQH